MSPEDIEQSTCTELPQKWCKKGSTTVVEHLFQPVRVSEFCHLPKRKQRRIWNKNVADYVLANVKAMIYKGMNARKWKIYFVLVTRQVKKYAVSTMSSVILFFL